MTIAQTIRALDNDMKEVAILYHLIETCGPGAFTAAEHSSDPARKRAARHVRELTFFDNRNGCGNG